MLVMKRDGHRESVKFDKITARIQKLCYGLSPLVDPVAVAMRVMSFACGVACGLIFGSG